MNTDIWARSTVLCLIAAFLTITSYGKNADVSTAASVEEGGSEAAVAGPPPERGAEAGKAARSEVSAGVIEEIPAAPAPARQPAEDAAPAPSPAAPAGEAPLIQAPEKAPTAPGRVTIDFKDADIANILRIFSRRYGVNIVAGPDVRGTVTIRLIDVPWETALRLILEANNYTFVREDNVIRVLSRDQIEKEPLKTEVFPLSYATASDVVNSITHLLTPGRGQVKADARSNTLVVTDVPAKLDEIEEVVRRLDRRTPQVLIEARILELSDDFDENIGINWIALKGYQVTIGPPADEGFFTIKREEIRARDDTTERKYIDRDISRRESQSGIGTLGTEDSFGEGEDTGTTTETVISTKPGVDSGTTITTKSPQETVQDVRGSIFEDYYKAEGIDKKSTGVTTTEITQAVLTPDNFQLALNFLQEQTDANLISHPKLVTADNKEAVIKVAEQYPIPNFMFNDDTGQLEVNGFEYKDIGIILTVTPQVNEDDYVSMKVVPEVSVRTGTVTFGGSTNAEIPIIATRTAETDVLVKSGDTLAIGGLIAERESTLVNKMPLFGDIPLAGPYLFSYSRKEISKSNILIFVTANIIEEDNKDSLWLSQRRDQQRRLNLPTFKWWEPKKLRYGLGAGAGY